MHERRVVNIKERLSRLFFPYSIKHRKKNLQVKFLLMQIKPDSLISSVLFISFTVVLQFLLELWNSPARMFENVASSFMELCNSTDINTFECEQSNYRGHVWIFQDMLWSPKPAPWPRQVWHREQGFICGTPGLGAGISQTHCLLGCYPT